MNVGVLIAGISLVLVFTVAVVVIIIHFIMEEKKHPVSGDTYDERQKSVRNHAGYIGFFVLLALNFVGIVGSGVEAFRAHLVLLLVFSEILSLCIFVDILIWKDAYFTVGKTNRGIISLSPFLAALSIVSIVLASFDSESEYLWLVVAAFVFYMNFFVNLILKRRSVKKRGENE